MKENICEGCIYDVDRIKNDVEKYNVLENCLHCKRDKKEEYRDKYPDLYDSNEQHNFMYRNYKKRNFKRR